MTSKQFCNYINAGSNGTFFKSMRDWAVIKFGATTSKLLGDKSSWSPTMDKYANDLLNGFVGMAYIHNHYERIFLRTILARELANYLSTGIKEEGLYERVKKAESDYWAKGHGTSIWTKVLTN